MEPALQELRDCFFRILDEGSDQRQTAHKVWVLFIEHPWFQAELGRAVRRVLWRVGEYERWADDIEQEALLLLARKLTRKASLGVNRATAARQFFGWLARIIHRACGDTARSMRRRERHAAVSKAWIDAVAPTGTSIDDLLDLAQMIERLPGKCRSVVTLHLRGRTLGEIGRALSVSRSHAHRGFRDAIVNLRNAVRATRLC
jgi:RNA polymerase sigma factor (sigma-70 family)